MVLYGDGSYGELLAEQSPKAFFFKPSMFKALRILHLFGLSTEIEENAGN